VNAEARAEIKGAEKILSDIGVSIALRKRGDKSAEEKPLAHAIN
jgi:hypothetical protein